jgi:anti-sigma B factor antagonist
MSLEVHIDGGPRVVARGELDMATTPHLVGAIEALERTETQWVVLDLSGVTFIDSTAISALGLARAKLDVRGAVLVLGPLSEQVESVLRIVGRESEFVREPHLT